MKTSDLANQLNVSEDRLNGALNSLAITIEDVADNQTLYIDSIKSELGLTGSGMVVSPQMATAGPISTASKAGKAKITKAGKLTTAQKRAQQAQKTVNQFLDSATLALIEEARALSEGSESITDEIAAYVADRIDSMPATLASKVHEHLQESGGGSRVTFSGLSAIAEKHLEALR